MILASLTAVGTESLAFMDQPLIRAKYLGPKVILITEYHCIFKCNNF